MITINLTAQQAELLTDILAIQLQIETEHLDNCLDSISKHNTRNIINRMQRLQKKITKAVIEEIKNIM